ncbi:MAG: amidase-like protein [Betaproteobacteria bacterium]|nr:amidase-like protein [Betaproteobacteria bacterium]
MDNSELAFEPIHALSRRLRDRTLTASALLDVYLERIRHYDEKLHAFVDVHEKEARAAAERADGALAQGRTLGPLHGVPIAYKDLLHMEGAVTRGGSVGADQQAAVTATAIQRLSAAGMIAIGKTHMVEAAFGSWGTNTKAGAPWNPWDLQTHRVPGGSSSGSGVAVAAGLAPAALGSDTGGSVRIPASLCGIVGLKTTVGRVSNHGVLMLSDTLDTLGPMTRDVEDAALLFDAMHGPDALDSRTQAHPRIDVLSGLKSGVKGMRLAIFPAAELGSVEPAVMRAFEDALEVLRTLGATIETITPPANYNTLAEATGKIIAAEGYEKLQERIDSNEPPMDDDVRKRLASGKEISAVEYIRILAERRRVMNELDAKLSGFDALLTPTTPAPAISVSEVDQRVAPMSRLTRSVNLLDLCAVALPCGYTDESLPLSLQVIGRGYDEARVLRIAWAYENTTEWHTRRPMLALVSNE